MTDKGTSAGSTTPPKPILFLMELRAPFFTASVVPVLVGTALAFHHTNVWNWPLFPP